MLILVYVNHRFMDVDFIVKMIYPVTCLPELKFKFLQLDTVFICIHNYFSR